ncbi:MAG: hypothetical protein EOO38_32675 [Cytophagaceae bacterium]|nr:MAG: hypothetical protein EOO38_32675 [Cytophagaceae bacterium]
MQILTPLCRDITFVGEGSNSLTWRSHYSLIVKRQLADLLENGQTQILCVLRITDARSSRYIAFDPMPDLGFTGTTQGSKAVELAVTLPLAKTISLKSANLLLIQGVAQNLSGIKALKSDAITSQARPETGVPCFYDTSKGASTVGNPTTLKTTMLDLKSSTVPDLKVQSVLPVPVSGRNLASCAGVSLKSVTATVQSEFTCQTYQDTKTEGLEAGCQWQLATCQTLGL